MVSIKDVAKHAGISFKTVSRVVNNDPAVREETRAKVLKSIEALNYRPNRAARMMRNQRSGVIGFISDEVVTRPYAGELLLGAQEIANQHDRVLMVVNIEQDRRRLQQALDMLLERRVEGLVFASYFHREVEVPDEMLSVPSVLANCFSRNAEVATFLPDERQAGRDATRLLIEQGHQRIAFITLAPQIAATGLRLEGYRQALQQAGLELDPQLVVQGEALSKAGEPCTAASATETLMQLESRPTAIVCGNDKLALEVYFLLLRYGLQVGVDIAITSFDNQLLIAPNLTPGLTTMALPHLEMGRAAVRHLFSGDEDRGTTLIPFPLIERESHLLNPCLSLLQR